MSKASVLCAMKYEIILNKKEEDNLNGCPLFVYK